MLKINEIFFSIQGEGQFTGTPVVFVRLAGCNLNCSFCDTDHSEKLELTEDQVLDEVKKYNCNTIVITGGEPLLQDLEELLKKLHLYNIHLETNGTIDIPIHWRMFDWITCSPKDGQGIKLEGYWVNEFKLIISEQDTIERVKEKIEMCEVTSSFTPIYLQPCWCASPVQREKNIQHTIQLVKELACQCKLSIQVQKFVNIK